MEYIEVEVGGMQPNHPQLVLHDGISIGTVSEGGEIYTAYVLK